MSGVHNQRIADIQRRYENGWEPSWDETLWLLAELSAVRERNQELRLHLEVIANVGEGARRAYYEPRSMPELLQGLPTKFSQLQAIARAALAGEQTGTPE